MWKLQWWDMIGGDVGWVLQTDSFETEREARAWLNVGADGEKVFTIIDPSGEVVVQSRFPVLMVA